MTALVTGPLSDAHPRCATCGSTRVLRDAWACWDPRCGDWVLGAVFDHAVCDDCGEDTRLVWSYDKPLELEASPQ